MVVTISGKRYDEKVDIFSFGIVLCEVRTWNYSQLFEHDLFLYSVDPCWCDSSHYSTFIYEMEIVLCMHQKEDNDSKFCRSLY